MSKLLVCVLSEMGLCVLSMVETKTDVHNSDPQAHLRGWPWIRNIPSWWAEQRKRKMRENQAFPPSANEKALQPWVIKYQRLANSL